MTRSHLKYLAKRQLEGNVGILFLASLISFSIIAAAYILMVVISTVLIAFLEELGIIIAVAFLLMSSLAMWIIVNPAFTVGRIMLLQRIAEDPDGDYGAGYIFQGFKHFWGAFKVQFCSGWLTFVWSLLGLLPDLLIMFAILSVGEIPTSVTIFSSVPRIIKTYSYSQAMYVYAEDTEMGAFASITRSKLMMRGRKFDYFVLIKLSFYPWMLLMPLTLGILGIWLYPYIELTKINFYNHAKNVPGHPAYGFPAYKGTVPSYAFFPAYGRDSYQDDIMRPDGAAAVPNVETPIYQQPLFCQPEYQPPVYQPPVAQQPIYQPPVAQQPVYQQPEYQPPVTQPVAEQPVFERPVFEQPVVEETVAVPRESVVEETVAVPREPVVEETVAITEEPVVEEISPIAEEPDEEATVAVPREELGETISLSGEPLTEENGSEQ